MPMHTKYVKAECISHPVPHNLLHVLCVHWHSYSLTHKVREAGCAEQDVKCILPSVGSSTGGANIWSESILVVYRRFRITGWNADRGG